MSILTYVGCPVFGNEAAMLFGDDIDFRANIVEVDLVGFPAMVFMLRRAGSGRSALNRARQVAAFLTTGGRAVVEQMANHCSAAGGLASRLGLGSEVQAGVEQAYARWDGRGEPKTLAGDALSLSARISHIAEACEVFQRTAGISDAVDMVRSRSGSHFDPTIAAVLELDPESLFDGIGEDTVEEILGSEPVERPPLTNEELDSVLEAIGDFCDLRCSFFAGHARGTTDLVAAAADQMQMPPATASLIRRAALIHDVGTFGVPGSVWNKPGPLTPSDQERMRLHVYYVERIFARPDPLRRIGLLAGAHHERMDGSGYHRGVGGTMLSAQARLLAAADAYHTMTQYRPHSAARTEGDTVKTMRAEAAAGRLDPVATEAVLAAAGHATSRARAGGPAGLTLSPCDDVAASLLKFIQLTKAYGAGCIGQADSTSHCHWCAN